MHYHCAIGPNSKRSITDFVKIKKASPRVKFGARPRRLQPGFPAGYLNAATVMLFRPSVGWPLCLARRADQ